MEKGIVTAEGPGWKWLLARPTMSNHWLSQLSSLGAWFSASQSSRMTDHQDMGLLTALPLIQPSCRSVDEATLLSACLLSCLPSYFDQVHNPQRCESVAYCISSLEALESEPGSLQLSQIFQAIRTLELARVRSRTSAEYS